MKQVNTLKLSFNWSFLVTLLLATSVSAATNTLHDKPEKASPTTSDETYVWDVTTNTLKKTTFADLPISTQQQTAISSKANKSGAVLLWSEWENGTSFTTSSPAVQYGGKLYACIAPYTKTAGETPDTLTDYFAEVAGGSGAIAWPASDGKYYGAKDGAWADLSSVFAAPLGGDDNYVTDAEKIKLANLSGTNTGDQDLSGYALKANVLELTNTTAFTPDADYEPATKKYVDDSIVAGGSYTDEQAQDAWGALLSGGTQTGISVTYNDAGGTANFVVSESDPVFMAWDKSTGISITKSQVSDFGSYAPPLGADDNYVTDAEKTKLAGIAEGAEVNVNADWNASSGDAQILNKPTIPTVSTAAYNTSTWDASTSIPDQNALRDYLVNFDTDGDGDFTDEAWFPTGSSMVYPGTGIPNSTGSAWGTSYSLVTTVGAAGTDTNIPSEQAVREALNLKANTENIAFLAGALTDLKIKTTAQPTNGEPLIDDTVTYGATDDNLRLWSIDKIGSELAGKAAASCFADAASFNTCFTLDWPTDYLTSTNLVTGSTDNAVIRADGTGGKTTQASGVTIDDSDNLTTTGTLSGKTAIVVNSDTASYSVTQAQARANTLFLTTNAATTTYTLPAAEAGMIVCFKMGQGNSQILRVDTDGTDYIVKSTGTRTSAAGDYYGATASATNRICVAAYDTTDWYVESEVGTWTEE